MSTFWRDLDMEKGIPFRFEKEKAELDKFAVELFRKHEDTLKSGYKDDHNNFYLVDPLSGLPLLSNW